jgi:hypothetical protein
MVPSMITNEMPIEMKIRPIQRFFNTCAIFVLLFCA